MNRLILIAVAAFLAGPTFAQTRPKAAGPAVSMPRLTLAIAASGLDDHGRAILNCSVSAARRLTNCSVVSASPTSFGARAMIAATTTPPVPTKYADGAAVTSPLRVGFAAAPNAGDAVGEMMTLKMKVPDARSTGAAVLSCGLAADRKPTGCKVVKESSASFGALALTQMSKAPAVPKVVPGLGAIDPPVRFQVVGVVDPAGASPARP